MLQKLIHFLTLVCCLLLYELFRYFVQSFDLIFLFLNHSSIDFFHLLVLSIIHLNCLNCPL